jgi:N-acetylmuramoyl-L-alanine amidase CwlA
MPLGEKKVSMEIKVNDGNLDDKGVYQAIPTTNVSHHAGNFEINNRSIGIEIAKSMKNNIEEKNHGINNSLLLIVLLMNYYDISIENVITHYDASGKHCPHDIFDRYGLDLFYEELKNLTQDKFTNNTM